MIGATSFVNVGVAPSAAAAAEGAARTPSPRHKPAANDIEYFVMTTCLQEEILPPNNETVIKFPALKASPRP